MHSYTYRDTGRLLGPWCAVVVTLVILCTYHAYASSSQNDTDSKSDIIETGPHAGMSASKLEKATKDIGALLEDEPDPLTMVAELHDVYDDCGSDDPLVNKIYCRNFVLGVLWDIFRDQENESSPYAAQHKQIREKAVELLVKIIKTAPEKLERIERGRLYRICARALRPEDTLPIQELEKLRKELTDDRGLIGFALEDIN